MAKYSPALKAQIISERLERGTGGFKQNWPSYIFMSQIRSYVD